MERGPGRPRPTDELLKAQQQVMDAQASLMNANRTLEIAISRINTAARVNAAARLGVKSEAV